MAQSLQTGVAMCLDSDLFGSVIVTIDDVELWLDAVPKIPRDNPSRRQYYAQKWDVVSKIISAKKSGDFYDIAARFLQYEIDNHAQTTQAIFAPKYRAAPPAPRPHRLSAILDATRRP